MDSILLAYIGPEVLLPLMSVLAAIFGGLLIGWRWIVAFVGKGGRFLSKRPAKESGTKAVTQHEVED